jgi:hypothetical protein
MPVDETAIVRTFTYGRIHGAHHERQSPLCRAKVHALFAALDVADGDRDVLPSTIFLFDFQFLTAG